MEGDPMTDALAPRLLALAKFAAQHHHSRWKEGTLKFNEAGHDGPFSLCSHPDCAALREAEGAQSEVPTNVTRYCPSCGTQLTSGADTQPTRLLGCLGCNRTAMWKHYTDYVLPGAQREAEGRVPPAADDKRVEKLARLFAEEYLTGHYRPLRDDEQKQFDQLFVVMLTFFAQAREALGRPPHAPLPASAQEAS